jgi:26S proteasome non-ATPase regulatory subunit 10
LTYGAPDYFGADPSSLFRFDDERIKLPLNLTRHQDAATVATFVGRMRMRDKYIGLCRAGGDYVANGFGHMAAAAAELIVESARDAEVQLRVSQAGDEDPEPPCEPSNHPALCAIAKTLKDAAFQDCPDRISELIAADGLDSKNGEPSAALSSAINTGHDAIALRLIELGAPVNPVTSDDWSKPLFLAAHRNRIGVLQALIKAGADANQKDRNGGTWLATYGCFNTHVSKVLLEGGADPNARDDHGATALMHAAHWGYGEEAKLLLEYHAEVDLKDNQGRTALMYAAESEYVDAIPLLLDRGADPLWQDINGQTALDLAKKSGNTVAMTLLQSALSVRR